jgi:hypothetical protein
MKPRFGIALACGLAAVTSAPVTSEAGTPSPRQFTVDFAGCTEFAGVGPVDLAAAQALVPSGFTTLTVGSGGAIVVRATACDSFVVNGGAAQPGIISQIGVEIVPPDNTGDINNYTLLYVTNDRDLAEAYRGLGLPAIFDPTLTYEFTYDSSGSAGELYVTAQGPELPAYFLFGTETDPTAPGSDFKANWWYKTPSGATMKQAGDYPDIAFGTASVTVYTSKNSTLGNLMGGNSDGDFHYLPLRGVYSSAHLVVTVTKTH